MNQHEKSIPCLLAVPLLKIHKIRAILKLAQHTVHVGVNVCDKYLLASIISIESVAYGKLC